jgi:hypothetical protein
MVLQCLAREKPRIDFNLVILCGAHSHIAKVARTNPKTFAAMFTTATSKASVPAPVLPWVEK